MRLFFASMVIAAAFAAPANAQQPDYQRFNEMAARCRYTASQIPPRDKDKAAAFFNQRSAKEWETYIAGCTKAEANYRERPSAPVDTVLAGKPGGEPVEIFKPSIDTPKGFYRCDPVTKKPQPASRFGCGPLQ